MTAGIYVIRHVDSGRVYIGQSQNIEKRWINHRTTLNRDCHHNEYLQRCWNKYGSDAFVFEIVEEEEDLSKLSALEERHMLSVDKKLRLNLAEDTEVPFRGRRHSEATKRIFSEAAKLRKYSDETKAKMSESQKRRYSTPEGRRARSEAAKKYYSDPENRRAHSRRQKEWSRTDEARKKQSTAQKLSYERDPGRRQRLSEAHKKRWSSEERIKLSRKKGGRAVIATDLSTGEEKRYDYLEAVKEDGFAPSNVRRVLRGGARHHKWHTWRYEE